MRPKIIRGGMKAPIATDWVAVADLTGTGEAILASANIIIPFNTLPSLFSAKIEIRFTHRRVSGTGSVYTWSSLSSIVRYANIPTNDVGASWYTSREYVVGTPRTRRILLDMPVLLHVAGINLDDSIYAIVHAAGSAADTEISVTGIQGRLIYVPL